jgi:DNA-binding transcriptional ArsR family regulator
MFPVPERLPWNGLRGQVAELTRHTAAIGEQPAHQPVRQRTELWHPSREEIDLGHVLAALADLHRRHVVTTLLCAPAGSVDRCAAFGLPLSKSTRTHLLRVLREAGLIRVVDLGNRLTVMVRRDDIDARFPGLLDGVLAGTPPIQHLPPTSERA